MGKIHLESTSSTSAKTEDIVLRKTKTTRLLFRPLVVNNVHDQEASVNGDFIFQRKSPTHGWEDYKELNLSNLKADEWVSLHLKSAEVLKLYRFLSNLYSIYKQEGIPSGESQFIRADIGLGALINTNEEDLTSLLDKESEGASELLSRLLNWLAKFETPTQIIDKLEQLEVSGLQQLSSLVGVTTLKSALDIWEDNRENPNEEFWQETFSKYSFVLSQVFAFPIVILEDKAYMGGKSMGNVGGKIVDFLARNDISKNAILIEIKTPKTPLLGPKYRSDVYSVSSDISGALIQIANYKHNLQREFYSLRSKTSYDFESFDPDCIVVAGDYHMQIIDPSMKKSFELFRSNLQSSGIITYDELYGKVRLIIDLLEGKQKIEKQELE